MTQKENLLLKAMEIENQINVVEGKEEKVIDTNSWNFKEEARSNKVYELEDRIEYAERKLEQAKEKKAEAEWLTTDEGKAYSARLEQAENVLHTTFSMSKNTAINNLNHLFQQELGEKWGLCRFDDSVIEIGIIDVNKPMYEDGIYKEVFGHRFTVYVGINLWDDKDRFEINYGCLGNFSPAKDADWVDFLQGLAKFASDKSIQSEVARIHKEYVYTMKKARAEYKAIEAQKNVA